MLIGRIRLYVNRSTRNWRYSTDHAEIVTCNWCCCSKYTGVALADAKKRSINVLGEAINVPVLELSKTCMLTPEELPENKYYIFGQEGAKILQMI
jgi:hypothetical protein